MRDTVWAIILTQAPIAVGCILVAMELRGTRKALEELARIAGRMTKRETDERD